jgi:hypothetical protein
MGVSNEDVDIKSSNVEMDRVERLFTGDDSTSVGTLFTANHRTIGPEKQDISNNNNSTNTKSGSTSQLTSHSDININRISNEIISVKTMMQQILDNQARANSNSHHLTLAGSPVGETCNKP